MRSSNSPTASGCHCDDPGIESQASVKQWAAGAGFGHDPAEVREDKLRILADFCAKVGKQPDELVAFCILRKKATGERFLRQAPGGDQQLAR